MAEMTESERWLRDHERESADAIHDAFIAWSAGNPNASMEQAFDAGWRANWARQRAESEAFMALSPED